MAKKVLVVSTSLRGNSNSEILAKECERGAKDAGHEVEFVSLRGKDIRFCIRGHHLRHAYLLLRDVRPDEDAA